MGKPMESHNRIRVWHANSFDRLRAPLQRCEFTQRIVSCRASMALEMCFLVVILVADWHCVTLTMTWFTWCESFKSSIWNRRVITHQEIVFFNSMGNHRIRLLWLNRSRFASESALASTSTSAKASASVVSSTKGVHLKHPKNQSLKTKWMCFGSLSSVTLTHSFQLQNRYDCCV